MVDITEKEYIEFLKFKNDKTVLGKEIVNQDILDLSQFDIEKEDTLDHLLHDGAKSLIQSHRDTKEPVKIVPIAKSSLRAGMGSIQSYLDKFNPGQVTRIKKEDVEGVKKK